MNAKNVQPKNSKGKNLFWPHSERVFEMVLHGIVLHRYR